jgi:hypothetical protein
MRKHLIAGLSLVMILTLTQVALPSSNGQSVSTDNHTTTDSASKCVVDATAALTTAGFRHVTSTKTHKDSSVVLFADHDDYQATVFCMNKYMAMEVTGPHDAPATKLRDAFSKAWDNEQALLRLRPAKEQDEHLAVRVLKNAHVNNTLVNLHVGVSESAALCAGESALAVGVSIRRG